ncbi:hypothetical protein BBK36DRAFT_1185068 [Trichoderma citrinoviride]|uniref:Uncharacterized protein n=1 Tax=Trichoderma citrinoviride TaxID=58853 RepID=A0A2T4AZE6_9HYPO|nr:hypothetical protein BBK36DRAFT_1185068 [Trichoderma citrinoviride]PTB62358.1 hypothetical protein BBK36DRAFT_1185068 [Trichoderma citrinoviride]
MKSTGASQRAAEITSAMLSVPGYADDTMLFMMRYGSLARVCLLTTAFPASRPPVQETLRKVDWDEFQVRLSALNKHWFASRSSGCRGTTTAVNNGDGETACTTAAKDGTTTATSTTTTAAAAASAAADSGVEAEAEAEAQEAHDSRTAELRARTLELVQDFPPLVRDFDKFVDCTRITAMRYGRGGGGSP